MAFARELPPAVTYVSAQVQEDQASKIRTNTQANARISLYSA